MFNIEALLVCTCKLLEGSLLENCVKWITENELKKKVLLGNFRWIDEERRPVMEGQGVLVAELQRRISHIHSVSG